MGGFAAGFSPQLVNERLLGEMVVPAQASDGLTWPLTAREVDQMIDLDLSYVVDGVVVVWVRIPGLASAERLDVAPLDLPPTLNAALYDCSAPHPIVPVMRNALLARETFRYVTGGTDDVPVSFPAGCCSETLECHDWPAQDASALSGGLHPSCEATASRSLSGTM